MERKQRKYTGPAKGSDEAKERMAKVRAAQWAKNNLVVSSETHEDDGEPPPSTGSHYTPIKTHRRVN